MNRVDSTSQPHRRAVAAMNADEGESRHVIQHINAAQSEFDLSEHAGATGRK